MDDDGTINSALIVCVKALGGSKQVGPMVWPEVAPDAAQRKLLDCLNPDRPQHLTPEQLLLIARKARERNCHALAEFIAADLGYAHPEPIEPEDERAKLQREFIESTAALARLAERIERLSRPVAVKVSA